MSLTNVWLQTLGDGLTRADQVVGVDVHQTPALSGKAPHWLLDVVLASPTGSGTRGEWDLTVLHRTLAQTSEHPGDAATTLVRLLAQLDAINAAGIVVTARAGRGADDVGDVGDDGSSIRFRFTPFPSPPPGHHTGVEYL